MAVRGWHWGKLVILWGWGLLVMGLAYSTLAEVEAPLFGFFLIGLLALVPVLLSCLTWIWLGGKES